MSFYIISTIFICSTDIYLIFVEYLRFAHTVYLCVLFDP